MEKIEVKYDLDLSAFMTKMQAVSDQLGTIEDKINAQRRIDPFSQANSTATEFNKHLGQQAQLYMRVQGAESSLLLARKRLEAQLKDLKSRQLEFIAAGRYGELKTEIKEVEERLRAVNNVLEDAPQKAEGVASGFNKIGTAIKTAFTVTGILFVIEKVVEIGKKLIEVTGIGEKYQNQFTRIFEGNGDAAAGYLSTLQTVADTTNFTFDTLADNAAKLASRGIIPTQKELLGLGDTANFIGKDFDQLNEAILDANNSERWKELGFVVKTQGDKMTLSYGDFTTTVENSVKGAYSAIQAFSQQGKVLGSTAEAGKTLSGRISTLGDTFVGLFRTIGNGNKGVLNDIIDLLTLIVQKGIELYKNLTPAFDAVGAALSVIGRAVGGVFTAFGNFQTGAEKTATISQKLGFYINKYIISPFVGITLVVAGVIEAFNLVVQAAQLVAGKLSGNKGLEATVSSQIKGTMARLQDLRKEGQKVRDNLGQDLASYTAKDNARKAKELADQKKQEAALANFRPTTGGGSNTTSGGKTKPDEKAIKAATDEYNLLLEGKKKYQEELDKLESQYGKEQLEALDKNSVEYITRKAQLDRDEIKAERDHLTELYRIKEAKSTRVNPLTNKREAVIDPTLQLPQASQDIYDNRSAAVTAEANRKIEELRYQNSLRLLQITRQFDKLEVEEVRKKWEDIIKAELLGFTGTAKARAEKEAELRAQQKADTERVLLGQAITQIRSQEELSLAYVNSAEVDRDLKLQKYTKDQTLNIEKEKEKMRLKIRIESGEKLIAYLEAQGAKENALLIRNAKNEVDAAKKAQKDLETTKLDYSSGAGFFGSLLGLEGDDLDQFKKAADAIEASIRQVTAAQIEASDKRIAAIDAEIQAKEEQIKIEEERSKDGFANNLKLREEELQNLKAQKAQEEAVRRKAVKTQQELDLISSTSSNIATTASLIGAAAKAFNGYIGIPFVGIALAIAAVASIYATIASFRAKAKSLTALRDGGRVPLWGRTHEQGGHRIEGTDIEVERGEHVVNARSSDKYDEVLTAINEDDPRAVFQAMIRQFSFGLPPVIVSQLQRPDFGRFVPALDTSRLEKQVAGMSAQVAGMATEIREMAAHIANLPTSQVVSLGDGRVLERDKGRTVITEHGKK